MIFNAIVKLLAVDNQTNLEFNLKYFELNVKYLKVKNNPIIIYLL